jgi:hypothetical protein
MQGLQENLVVSTHRRLVLYRSPESCEIQTHFAIRWFCWNHLKPISLESWFIITWNHHESSMESSTNIVIPICSMCGIFTYKTGWFLGQMLVNIPAPWSILSWILSPRHDVSDILTAPRSRWRSHLPRSPRWSTGWGMVHLYGWALKFWDKYIRLLDMIGLYMSSINDNYYRFLVYICL